MASGGATRIPSSDDSGFPPAASAWRPWWLRRRCWRRWKAGFTWPSGW